MAVTGSVCYLAPSRNLTAAAEKSPARYKPVSKKIFPTEYQPIENRNSHDFHKKENFRGTQKFSFIH
jgi:hypothetical protein